MATHYKTLIYKLIALLIALLLVGSYIFPYFQKASTKEIGLTTLNPEVYSASDTTKEIRSIKKLSECAYPVQYGQNPSSDGQYMFKSYISEKLDVKLIPNYEQRKKLQIKEITNIVGVNQFFIDHDLTSGYVHPYTLNFYNKLRPDDFVLKYEASANDALSGFITYIQKKDTKPQDKLGQNLALFRQWKLSEIDLKDDKIRVAKCNYAHGFVCPQVKQNSNNPFKTEIPIANTFPDEGYFPLKNFNDFDCKNGGTAVIIWEDSTSKSIKFMDIHGSMQMIISEAIVIAKSYHTDPTIAISDAGAFSLKFKSNENNVLNTKQIDEVSDIPYVSAGFGYIPQKATEFEITYKDGSIKRIIVVNGSEAYRDLVRY